MKGGEGIGQRTYLLDPQTRTAVGAGAAWGWAKGAGEMGTRVVVSTTKTK